MKSILIDLTGKRFNRLLVLNQGDRLRPKVPRWVCLCDCGKTIVTDGKSLRHGLSRSCGCLKNEKIKQRSTTHGMTNSSEYKTWCGIKKRCYNKNEMCYPSYGGRGITMSEEWKHSFDAFLRDVGPKPSANHSIERIDPNGNYQADNCKWIPLHEQARNKRNTILLTASKVTKTMVDWSKETGIPYATIQARILKGWTEHDAVTKPLMIEKRNKLSKKVPSTSVPTVIPGT